MVAQVRRTVIGMVKSKAEGPRGLLIEFDTSDSEIDFFQTKFPTKIDFIPKEFDEQLIPGRQATLELGIGNLKKDHKTNAPHDGSKPWHYWWNFIGLGYPLDASPAAVQAPRPATTPQGGTPQPTRGAVDPTRRSIEKQVALKAAVEWSSGDSTAETVIAVAQVFFDWLQGDNEPTGPVEAKPESEAKPVSTPASTETLQASDSDASDALRLKAQEQTEWQSPAAQKNLPF
jgi:hypothetical protein